MEALDSEYKERAARDTLAIIAHGVYTVNGEKFELGIPIGESIFNSFVGGRPDAFLTRGPNVPMDRQGSIEVIQEDVLSAAYRLQHGGLGDLGDRERIGVLNYVSATEPGAGVARVIQTDMDNVAIRSTLYESLKHFKDDFFKANTQSAFRGLYVDSMLYTPRIEVFKDANLHLTRPWECTVVTCPAPNVRVARQCGVTAEQINMVVDTRIRMMLDMFMCLGYTNIVLGPFGCGPFGNNAAFVASRFNEYLNIRGYRHAFNRIIFAIKAEKYYKTFKEQIQEEQI